MYSDHESYVAAVEVIAAAPIPWERFAGRRFLVTGATGLTGTFLIDVLLRRGDGIEVIAVGRNAASATARFPHLESEKRFRFIAHDVSRPFDSFPDSDYIIHAASNSHPRAFSSDPVGTMAANFTGTYNLLEYARKREVRRLLYVSSGEVYGEGAPSTGFSEHDSGFVDPLLARSCYPSSKRAAETLCASYLAQYGVDSVIARPSHLYGPTITADDSHAVAQFIRNAAAGIDIVMKSSGTQVRSYCFVGDCVLAFLMILSMGESGQAYNIADRNSHISIRGLATILAEITGCRLLIDTPEDAEKAGYTSIDHASLNPSLLESLGWYPRTDLRDGLTATVKIIAGLQANQGGI